MPPDAPVLPARRALAPRYWGAHLLMLVAVLACVLLGRWQLGVWHDHRTDNSAAVTRETPVPLDDVLGKDAAFPASDVGRPVVVQGRWDPDDTVYVADRTQDGRTGFWAVTPVSTAQRLGDPGRPGLGDESHRHRGGDPRGPASLVGLLQPSEDTGAPDNDTHDDVIPEMSMTDLLPRAPYDLYGGYVVATDRALPSAGRRGDRDGRPRSRSTAEHLPGADASTGLRNLLYAFQWWVFGAFAIFMWWRWLQEDVLGRRPSPPARR